MTTPSANSKDDKNEVEAVYGLDSNGNRVMKCPFCDSSDHSACTNTETHIAYVICNSCGAQGPWVHVTQWTNRRIIEEWKRRAYLPQIQQLKHEVEDAKKGTALVLGYVKKEEFCAVQSQLLEANKRIEELERKLGYRKGLWAPKPTVPTTEANSIKPNVP